MNIEPKDIQLLIDIVRAARRSMQTDSVIDTARTLEYINHAESLLLKIRNESNDKLARSLVYRMVSEM